MLCSVCECACECACAPAFSDPLAALYFNPQHFLLLGLLFISLFIYLLLVYLHKNEDSVMEGTFLVLFTEWSVPVPRTDSPRCRAATGEMHEQSVPFGSWTMGDGDESGCPQWGRDYLSDELCSSYL